MDPISLAVTMAATAGGAILSGLGSAYQGQAQSNMYQYQAAIAGANQKIAAARAPLIQSTTETEAQQAGLAGRFQAGAQKVGEGAGNVDVTTGSAEAVRESTGAVTQENEAVIRARGAQQVYAESTVPAFEAGAQKGIYGMSAETSKTAGFIGMGSSFLSGAGQVAGKWYQASSSGIPLFGGGSGGASTSSQGY